MIEFKDFIYWIGDVFHYSFKILPILGNIPNYFYTIAMFAGLIYWLRWQKRMSEEARQNGTLE